MDYLFDPLTGMTRMVDPSGEEKKSPRDLDSEGLFFSTIYFFQELSN